MYSIPDPDDLPYLGSLALQHYLGPEGSRLLIAGAGSARGVYALSEAGLREMYPRIHSKMMASLLRGPDLGAWEIVENQCRRENITIVFPGMPGFPGVWNGAGERVGAPPPILFVRGEWRAADARAVALVGTREPSDYGVRAARALASGLAAAGYTVVSGLARGIDTVSHETALEAGGRTVAVIGCGLDVPYPPENAALRERIAACGAVISEHPPGAPPLRANFPRRNRIISALSQGIVVVEAGERSGALITAEEARRQDKVLFAVPGPMFQDSARGNHVLLRAGAYLAASAEDVIVALGGATPSRRTQLSPPARPSSKPVARQPAPPARAVRKHPPRLAGPALDLATEAAARGASDVTDPVLGLWSGDEACGLDALAVRAVAAGLWSAERAPSALLESLLDLEMQGSVSRLPGAVYKKTGR